MSPCGMMDGSEMRIWCRRVVGGPSGGLVVYNLEAPLEWDFKTYNTDAKKISEEILNSKQKQTVVPYNENRAIIFNSNLFHETDKIEFKRGYENRRINVTMLFGTRGL